MVLSRSASKKMRVVVVILSIMMLTISTVSVYAVTDTYKCSMGATAAGWNYQSQTKSTAYSIDGLVKLISFEKFFTGAYNVHPKYHVTDNHEHHKGVDDLTYQASKCHSFSFSGSCGVSSLKSFSASLGCTFSISTVKTITTKLNPKSKTGYWYYAVHVNSWDVKSYSYNKEYHKANGKYVYKKTTGKKTKTGCALEQNPYYSWEYAGSLASH